MNLFSLDPYTLPDGRVTHFKIECDALTDGDWEALARLAVELLPPFGAVEGVPQGGLKFANALRRYATQHSSRLLIADDVWVSGKSMEVWRNGRQATGIVAFNRGTLHPWVKTLFLMHAHAEQATYQLDRPPSITT